MKDFPTDKKHPHNALEWARKLFIIEVANISEFSSLDKENVTLEQLDKCSIKKKIGQISNYLLKNFSISGETEGYGAITCYSHWLFIKADLVNGKFSLVLHNKILRFDSDQTEWKHQTALSLLLSLLTFSIKASAYPRQLVSRTQVFRRCNIILFQNNVRDTSLTMLRTDDNRDICLTTQIVAVTTHSVVMKALWPDTKQLVCIKCKRGTHNLLANEINIIKRLNAGKVPNVPNLMVCGTLIRNGVQFDCLVTSLV